MDDPEDRERPGGVKAWRNRGAALVHDLPALGEVFLLICLYGLGLLLAAFWIGLAVRVGIRAAGF